jgi:hypothetical protein
MVSEKTLREVANVSADNDARAAAPATQTVELTEGQIIVDRQALLTIVRALDINSRPTLDLPFALDKLREPFFGDEMSSGRARTDFSLNKYEY